MNSENGDQHFGWRDPFNVFDRLQTAVSIMVRGKDNYRIRMDRATLALVTLSPDDFPERIRSRASMVLSARGAVRHDYVTDSLFHFERLKPKERRALENDILRLYEACMFDLGRMGTEFEHVYPKDREPGAGHVPGSGVGGRWPCHRGGRREFGGGGRVGGHRGDLG